MGVGLAKNLQSDLSSANMGIPILSQSSIVFCRLHGLWISDTNAEEPEVNVHRTCNNIIELCRKTKFSRAEIQFLYRGFKQVRSLP